MVHGGEVGCFCAKAIGCLKCDFIEGHDVRNGQISFDYLAFTLPAKNLELDYVNLKDDTTPVFLKSSPKELANRLYDKKNNRPLISHIQSKEQLEEMLQKGASVSEIVKYFLENGKTPDQENEELRQKMKKMLSEGNLSPELVLSALETNLTEAEKQKLNELIQRGLTTDEILKELMKGKESGKGREISETEQLALLRNQLGDKSKEELEKMLKEGHSLSEVIKYFMSPGTPGTDQSQDFEDSLRNILQREDLSEQEKIEPSENQANQ